MRTYTIKKLSDTGDQPVTVKADDVDLESVDGSTFWNFTNSKGDSTVTVAAFPFERVDHITSDEN